MLKFVKKKRMILVTKKESFTTYTQNKNKKVSTIDSLLTKVPG